MQDCGNRGIEMWFCIGMYFFLGACAWMYFKKKSLFRKWDRLLRQIFFLMLVVTSLAFLSEIVQKTGTENSETMQIKRNGYGEGQKEAALSMQVEGEKKQDIEIRVSPKIYSEKRLEKEFQKARKELAKVISGENKDLSHIKTDLDLVTALDDFPFSISWELSRYDVMDSLGRLDQEKIREEDPENQGIGMNITGVLHYEDKVYPCEMDLVIFAGQEKTLSTKERVLELVRGQCYEAESISYTATQSGRKKNCLDRGERFKSDSDSDARNGDKHSACRKRNTERKQSEEDEKRADDAGLSGNYHRVYDADRCRNDSKKCVEKDCGRLWDHQGENGKKKRSI